MTVPRGRSGPLVQRGIGSADLGRPPTGTRDCSRSACRCHTAGCHEKPRGIDALLTRLPLPSGHEGNEPGRLLLAVCSAIENVIAMSHGAYNLHHLIDQRQGNIQLMECCNQMLCDRIKMLISQAHLSH